MGVARKGAQIQRDVAAGDMDRANKRMNDNDGGLAKHSTICNAGIDWEKAKIVGKNVGGRSASI